MKTKIALLMLSIMSLSSLASCNSDAMDFLDRTGTITFYDGSTELGKITGKSGDPISDEDKLKITSFETKEDFAFRGWYSDVEITKPETLKYYTYKDYSVYGNFKPYVTISLDLNGGTFSEDNTITSLKGVSGDQILTELPTPTKEYAYFDNWYITVLDEETNTNVEKEFNLFSFPEKDITAVAHYTDFPVLSFELPTDKFGELKIDPVKIDPEKIISDQFTFSDEINAILNPTDTSYKFNGWFIKKDLTEGQALEEAYKDCAQLFFNQKIDKSITIFPMFSNKVTVNFEVEGTEPNEVLFAPVTEYANETFNAPEITIEIEKRFKEIKPSKYFTGWASKDEGGNLVPYSFIKMPDEDLTLYATFADNPVIKLYKDSSKSGSPLMTLNTFSPDEKIIVDDLENLSSKLGLLTGQRISHWTIEKTETVEGTSKVTKIDLDKEMIEGIEKSVYIVSTKDPKMTSISLYPNIETEHTLNIYEANYKYDTGLGRYVISKTSNKITETKGIVNFYEPTINLPDDSKTKISYYREVNKSGTTSFEEVSFPLSTENGNLKDIYVLLAKKITIEVGDIYVNNTKITSNKVGNIVLGYQNTFTEHKFLDIDLVNGTLVINGDVSKKVSSPLLKDLELVDVQLSIGSPSNFVKDLIFDANYNLKVPFENLGDVTTPVDIRILENF